MKKLFPLILALLLSIPCAFAEGSPFPFGLTGTETYSEAVTRLEAIWGPMEGSDEPVSEYDPVLDIQVATLPYRKAAPKDMFFMSLPCKSVSIDHLQDESWRVSIECDLNCTLENTEALISIYDKLVDLLGSPASHDPDFRSVSFDGESAPFLYFEHKDHLFEAMQKAHEDLGIMSESFGYSVLWVSDHPLVAQMHVHMDKYSGTLSLSWSNRGDR